MEEPIGEEGEEEQDLKRLKGRIGKKVEKANRKKISRLLEEYTQFKKKNIVHFRFNGSENSLYFIPYFGKFYRYFFDDSGYSSGENVAESTLQNPPSRSTLTRPPSRTSRETRRSSLKPSSVSLEAPWDF